MSWIYSHLSCLLLFYRVLNTLLPVLRKHYLILKEAGLSNVLIETEYEEVEQLIQRQKSVVWADQTEEEEPNQNHELEVSTIFAFPQLVNKPNTPCCKYIICSLLEIFLSIFWKSCMPFLDMVDANFCKYSRQM